MSTSASRFLIVTVLVLTCASNAAAQAPLTTSSPSFELSAGYQFLRLPDMNFPFGLGIDGAMHFGRFGLVAEGGWAMHSDEDEVTDLELTTNMWHIAAGPRFTGFNAGRAWPYAQVLVGAAIAHASLDADEFEADLSDTETALMVQPGFGLTFVAGDGWGLFGQVDFRRTFFEEDDDVEDSINNQFRIFIGARMILD
jgi:hypothetical protein